MITDLNLDDKKRVLKLKGTTKTTVVPKVETTETTVAPKVETTKITKTIKAKKEVKGEQ